MKKVYRINIIIQAMVWILFGLIGKILPIDGTHQQIIEKVFHLGQGKIMTNIIGVLEILFGLWILYNVTPKFNAITQIVTILSMNSLEQVYTPDLLRFGIWNLFFAIVFCLTIAINEFTQLFKSYETR